MQRVFDSYTFRRDRNGLDFTEYKTCDKAALRKELGLSSKKVYMSLVGRYAKFGGTNNTIKDLKGALKAVESLKKKIDIDLLLIGGRKNEELYPLVREADVIHLGVLTTSKNILERSKKESLTVRVKSNQKKDILNGLIRVNGKMEK